MVLAAQMKGPPTEPVQDVHGPSLTSRTYQEFHAMPRLTPPGAGGGWCPAAGRRSLAGRLVRRRRLRRG